MLKASFLFAEWESTEKDSSPVKKKKKNKKNEDMQMWFLVHKLKRKFYRFLYFLLTFYEKVFSYDK